MSYFKGFLVLAVLAITGCPELLDGGGGGGVGGQIAFIRNGQLTVSSDDGLGTGEQFLTEASTSADPALSPNGQSIAFAYSPAASAGSRGIYVVPVNGGVPVELALPGGSASFSNPAYSPDGAQIVFVSTDGADTKLLTIPSGGGTPDEVPGSIGDVNFPAFLDGNTLVVVQGLSNELNKLDLTTGVLTKLGLSSSSKAAAAPGGGRIAYSKDSAIVVRDLASNVETPLPTSGSGDLKPAFSPDGVFVAFEGGGKLYAARADGTGTIEVMQSGTDVSWGP